MIRKFYPPFLGILLILSLSAPAQNINRVRLTVDTLCSKYMAGRGYIHNGDLRAANYLADQYFRIGLQKFKSGYFQNYHFSINTFPGNALLQVNDTILEPGKDFLVSASCEGLAGKFELVWMTDTGLTLKDLRDKIKGMDLRKKFLVLERAPELMRDADLNNVKGVILLRDGKLTWSVSKASSTRKMIAIEILRDKLPPGTPHISLNIENKFQRKYRTQNVIGYISGKLHPDSFLVFTAHYDHLGMMGSVTYFPGANDNASGTAMILDLAQYYSLPGNQPDYSMVFIAFSGEESGLHGSEYYANHPLFPLKNIRFLVNLDMVGTGSDGIGVVNATFYPPEMELLEKINTENHYFKEIKKRGESAHSDHHPFYKKGVKAIFIYTFGDDYKDYHNLNDTSSKLPFTGYEKLFRLLTDFYSRL